MQPAIDIGNAASITRYNHRSAAVLKIGEFPFQHFGGYLRVLDGKNASKATALGRCWKLNEFSLLYCLQQESRLVVDAHISQQVAGRMVGNLTRKPRTHIGYAQVINEKLGEFVGTGGYFFRSRPPGGIVGK